MSALPVSQSQEAQEASVKINRVFVVLNPVAGTTDAGNAKDLITQYCQEQGWDCDIHETQKNEDVRKLVNDVLKKGVDIVVAAGGDGTVSEVVGGMINSKVPLGIIPAGTGNNLARDLSIPMDIKGALSLLGDDHVIQHMDVMEVNKKKFYVLNVSVGLTSQVMKKTKRQEKRRFGFLAYLWHAIESILHTDTHTFKLVVDDKSMRVRASELMIANSKFMGLQPQLEGLEIDPADGCMDVFIVRSQSFRDYLDLAAAFVLRRKPEDDPTLHHIEAREVIRIQSESPLPAQGDGEVIGSTPVEVRMVPDSLQIIVPRPAEAAK